MIDLVRDLLDRPLDPRHARAVVAIASCLTLAFAGLVAGGMIDGSPAPAPRGSRSQAGDPGRPTAPPPVPGVSPADRPRTEDPPPITRQDPQDRHGSDAYLRERRSLRGHGALQRLPYRHGGLSITLVSADHGRPIVRVEAATEVEARRRWTRFLRRSADDGTAYETRFVARARSLPAAPAHRRRGFHGELHEGFRGPFRGRSAENGRKWHHRRRRGHGDSLKSLPRPKASH